MPSWLPRRGEARHFRCQILIVNKKLTVFVKSLGFRRKAGTGSLFQSRLVGEGRKENASRSTFEFRQCSSAPIFVQFARHSQGGITPVALAECRKDQSSG